MNPTRSELEVRASAIGVDSTLLKYKNDSVFEQAIIYAESTKSPTTAAVAASTTLTSTGVAPTQGDTVTIAGRTYTFVTVVDNSTANQVLIGTAAQSLQYLKDAIQPTQAGVGVEFSSATPANGEIVCGAITATTLVIRAARTGAYGNALGTTKVAATLSFTGATMAGGVDGSGPRASDLAGIHGGANV